MTPSWHIGAEAWMRAEYGGASTADPVGNFNRDRWSTPGPT